MEQLWDFAKQIAQSDGRKNDWVYVVDVYKSIGGKNLKMEIQNETGRYEVLGEASQALILVCDSNQELQAIQKSDFKKFKKKFVMREKEPEKTVKKSLLIDGKLQEAIIYLD